MFSVKGAATRYASANKLQAKSYKRYQGTGQQRKVRDLLIFINYNFTISSVYHIWSREHNILLIAMIILMCFFFLDRDTLH